VGWGFDRRPPLGAALAQRQLRRVGLYQEDAIEPVGVVDREPRAQARKCGANRIDHRYAPKSPAQPRDRIAPVAAADIQNERVQIVAAELGQVAMIHLSVECAHGVWDRRALMETSAADIT